VSIHVQAWITRIQSLPRYGGMPGIAWRRVTSRNAFKSAFVFM
jgi:hypothetical protein